MFEDEIWRDIKGYEGIYQISNYSRIRSLPRSVERKSTLPNNKNEIDILPVKGRIMKQNIIGNTAKFTVRLKKDGEYRNRTVDSLFEEVFSESERKISLRI